MGPNDTFATSLQAVPDAHVLAVTQDTLLESVHFFADTPAFDVGFKSAVANLSDLASMGAEAAWLHVVVHGTSGQHSTDATSRTWLERFEQGFFVACDVEGLVLRLETAPAPSLRITVVAGGHVPSGQALQRNGARAGDLLAVTGTLGDAGGALNLLYEGVFSTHFTDHQDLRARLDRPTPRLAAGIALRSIARAAMDISDGLAGDVAHLLHGGLGAYIDSTSLPLSAPLVRVMGLPFATQLALSAGDDYELLIAVAPAARESAERAVKAVDTDLTWIGHLTQTGKIEIIPPLDSSPGYRHF